MGKNRFVEVETILLEKKDKPYAFAIPEHTTEYTFQARGGNALKVAYKKDGFDEGKFISIPGGASKTVQVDLNGQAENTRTLYFVSAVAGETVEIECWK